METSERDAILVQEYLQLQRVVEDYDQRALTIKAWSITFSAAGLGTAYLQHQPVLLLVAAISAFVFWIVEALWKTNQQAYYPRIHEIERHFAGEAEGGAGDLPPLAIGTSWSEAFRAKGQYWRAWRIMAWPHVALPHVVVMLAGLALLAIALWSNVPLWLGQRS